MRRHQQGNAGLFHFGLEKGRRIEPLGDDEAGDGVAAELLDVGERLLFRYLSEIRNLRVAEHLDPVGVQVFRIAGEGEPRLLDAGTVNAVPHTRATGEQHEFEPVLRIVEEILNSETDAVQRWFSWARDRAGPRR